MPRFASKIFKSFRTRSSTRYRDQSQVVTSGNDPSQSRTDGASRNNKQQSQEQQSQEKQSQSRTEDASRNNVQSQSQEKQSQNRTEGPSRTSPTPPPEKRSMLGTVYKFFAKPAHIHRERKRLRMQQEFHFAEELRGTRDIPRELPKVKIPLLAGIRRPKEKKIAKKENVEPIKDSRNVEQVKHFDDSTANSRSTTASGSARTDSTDTLEPGTTAAQAEPTQLLPSSDMPSRSSSTSSDTLIRDITSPQVEPLQLLPSSDMSSSRSSSSTSESPSESSMSSSSSLSESLS